MRAQEKAKRQQKSNSLTSVWDAVVASEGQRWKINRSWFAEGGEWEEERKRGKKTDSADKRNKKHPDSTKERQSLDWIQVQMWENKGWVKVTECSPSSRINVELIGETEFLLSSFFYLWNLCYDVHLKFSCVLEHYDRLQMDTVHICILFRSTALHPAVLKTHVVQYMNVP